MFQKASSWRNLLGAAIFGLASVFLAPGDCCAGTLIINITDGTTSYDVFDQIPPDTNFNLNQITADVSGLIFPDFNVVGLSAASNNPGDNNPLGAVLSLGGTVQRTTGGGNATLTITAYQTDFNLPSGISYTLINTSSTNYSNVPGGSTQTGESWYNPASPGTPPPPFGTAAPLILFGLSGTNSTGTTTMLGGLPPSSDFSLTTQVVLTIGGATGTTLPTVTFGSQAQILAVVPEPTSVVLMGTAAPLALLLLCKLHRGRKQAAA